MAERWRSSGHIARFIEYMDVGSSNGWRMDDVVPSAEVVRRISERWPLEPVGANYAGEVAARWRYADGAGEIGVISSVTQAFCGSCTRMRLSTEGALFTCLFAQSGHDLKSLVRGGASDEEIRDQIAAVWQRRAGRHFENPAPAPPQSQKKKKASTCRPKSSSPAGQRRAPRPLLRRGRPPSRRARGR